jgi:hypothetical protein
LPQFLLWGWKFTAQTLAASFKTDILQSHWCNGML